MKPNRAAVYGCHSYRISRTTTCYVSLAWITIFTCWFHLGQPVDVKPQKERYGPDYSIYHNLTSLQIELTKLTHAFPSIIKMESQYNSKLSRSQMVLHVTNFSLNADSPLNRIFPVRILFSYGEHAREFLPVESLLHLLKSITSGTRAPTGSKEDVYSRYILSRVDLYIIAMANPDGRVHVENSHNYCWRGTSTGVDLNRNFNWEFAQKGSSADPRDEEYRGKYAFSEPECAVYKLLTLQKNFDLYISFHSGIRQIYLPFADTHSHKVGREPENIKGITDLASTLASSTRHKFEFGKAYELTQYTADGTSFDYMAGIRMIPFSLAIELWGEENHIGRSCFDQFNPKSKDLQREVSDIHPMYVSMFEFMIQWKMQNHKKSKFSTIMSENFKPQLSTTPSHTLVYFVVSSMILLVCFLIFQARTLFCQRWPYRRRIVSLKTLSSTLSFWGTLKSM